MPSNVPFKTVTSKSIFPQFSSITLSFDAVLDLTVWPGPCPWPHRLTWSLSLTSAFDLILVPDLTVWPGLYPWPHRLTSSADWAMKNPCVLGCSLMWRGLMAILLSAPSSPRASIASSSSFSLVKHSLRQCPVSREASRLASGSGCPSVIGWIYLFCQSPVLIGWSIEKWRWILFRQWSSSGDITVHLICSLASSLLLLREVIIFKILYTRIENYVIGERVARKINIDEVYTMPTMNRLLVWSLSIVKCEYLGNSSHN